MKRVLIGLVVLLLLAVAAGAYLIIARSADPYKGYSASEQFVEVPPGASPNAIGRRLAAAGVVRDLATFRYALARSGQARRLQAGEYRFDRPLTAREVIDILARGDVYLRPITFREGLTIRQMAAVVRAGGGLARPPSSSRRLPTSPSINDLDPDARDLEGYLFPETYAMSRRATVSELVERMVSAFRYDIDRRRQVAGGVARSEHPRAGHAGIDHRERNRQVGRTADGCRRLLEPAANRHGAAVRSDGHLRARARRPLLGQSHPRGPALRLAVQHISIRGPAAGSDRRAGPRVTRGRRRPRPKFRTSTSSAATMVRTRSRARSTSTIATCSSIRSSRSGSEASDLFLARFFRKRTQCKKQDLTHSSSTTHDGSSRSPVDSLLHAFRPLALPDSCCSG